MIFLPLLIFLALIPYSQSFQMNRLYRSRSKKARPYQNSIPDQFANAQILRTNSSTMQLRLKTRTVKLLNVPDVMQATDYTCGPSSLSAVLNYYQYPYRESQLAKLAKTDPEYGTGPHNLHSVVEQLARSDNLTISAQLLQNMIIPQLEYYISQKRPIIVQIQAWTDDQGSYIDDFDDGHYVVVIGQDSQYLYFEDPWIFNSIAYISKKDFNNRWHDYVHSENRKVYNLGIVVYSTVKNTPVVIQLQ